MREDICLVKHNLLRKSLFFRVGKILNVSDGLLSYALLSMQIWGNLKARSHFNIEGNREDL